MYDAEGQWKRKAASGRLGLCWDDALAPKPHHVGVTEAEVVQMQLAQRLAAVRQLAVYLKPGEAAEVLPPMAETLSAYLRCWQQGLAAGQALAKPV